MDHVAGPVEGVFAARDTADDRALRRAVERGDLMRVRRGAYVAIAVWRGATPRRRNYLRIAAVAASRGFRDVFSHHSAAVLLGIETLSETPTVHVLDSGARATRTVSGLVLHSGAQDPREAVGLGPFRATGSARTLADLALTTSFSEGVSALDSGLHRAGQPARQHELRAAVQRELDGSDRVHGRSTAARVLAFADAGAANPGESLSRVLIAQLGFAAPVLQVKYVDGEGLIGFVDFSWPQAGVVGEFDGFAKYSGPEYLRGRTPSQVVVDEKKRERRLEALPQVRRVARWAWGDLTTPAPLFRELVASGVPRA